MGGAPPILQTPFFSVPAQPIQGLRAVDLGGFMVGGSVSPTIPDIVLQGISLYRFGVGSLMQGRQVRRLGAPAVPPRPAVALHVAPWPPKPASLLLLLACFCSGLLVSGLWPFRFFMLPCFAMFRFWFLLVVCLFLLVVSGLCRLSYIYIYTYLYEEFT